MKRRRERGGQIARKIRCPRIKTQIKIGIAKVEVKGKLSFLFGKEHRFILTGIVSIRLDRLLI